MSRLVFFGRIYSTEQKVVDVHVVSNIALGDKGIQQGLVPDNLRWKASQMGLN